MLRTAFKFIRYDVAKSFGALAGIVISVFLVGQQAGIFIFLTDAMRSIVDNNSGYIWITDETTTNANQLSLLDIRKGYEIGSLPGVARVFPVVVASAGAKFADGTTSGFSLIGSQGPAFVGGPWRLYTAKPTNMIPDGAVITDFYDAKALGNLKPGEYFEINGKKVYNAGLTRGARAFGGGLLAFTTLERARYLANVPTDKVSFYLVKPRAGVSESAVIQDHQPAHQRCAGLERAGPLANDRQDRAGHQRHCRVVRESDWVRHYFGPDYHRVNAVFGGH